MFRVRLILPKWTAAVQLVRIYGMYVQPTGHEPFEFRFHVAVAEFHDTCARVSCAHHRVEGYIK